MTCRVTEALPAPCGVRAARVAARRAAIETTGATGATGATGDGGVEAGGWVNRENEV